MPKKLEIQKIREKPGESWEGDGEIKKEGGMIMLVKKNSGRKRMEMES